jgi:hypothetical protein
MKELIEKTTIKAGLKFFVCILNKAYETCKKVAKEIKKSMRIVFNLKFWTVELYYHP